MASITTIRITPPFPPGWWTKPPGHPMGMNAEYAELIRTFASGQQVTDEMQDRVRDLASELSANFDRDLQVARRIRVCEKELGGRFARVEDIPGFADRQQRRRELMAQSTCGGDAPARLAEQLQAAEDSDRRRFDAYREWIAGPYGERLVAAGVV